MALAATSSNAIAAFHPWAKFAASRRLGGLSAWMLPSNTFTLSHVWRLRVAPENGHGADSQDGSARRQSRILQTTAISDRCRPPGAAPNRWRSRILGYWRVAGSSTAQ
jgi:hypothetical protein